MSLFNHFPYTNFHELNIDWAIQKIKDLITEGEALYTELQEWKTTTDAELEAWKTQTLSDLGNWKDAVESGLASWKHGVEIDFAAYELQFQTIKTACQGYRERAEAWAVGQINGEDVPDTDAAYHNSAKFWAEEAADSADEAASSATAGVNALANEAPTYSSSSTYAAGDYVIYDGDLYRCITAISTAEAWTAAHWTEVKLGPEAADLRNALDVYKGIAFPALNGKKTIEISAGTETGYYSNGTKVENARFKCIEFVIPRNAKKISYTYANAANAGAGCILSANRATIRTLSGTAEAHEYDIPSNACFVELNFFDGTYVEKYEITVEELAKESAISELASDVNDIEEAINGEYEDIAFTPTGSGYINTSNQLVYTAGDTGFNQIMIINDLPTAGLSAGISVTVKAGYLNNSEGCVGFSTSAITESGTIRLSSVVPWTSTEDSQEITFTIPSDAVAIAFFNRSPHEANPTIKAQTAIGIIAEISALNDKIDNIDENLFNVNNRTLFAKNIISKPLNFNEKTVTVFGDSIAYGYASNPLAPITNCWVNLFATKTGATIVNQAVAGSTLATRTGHSNSIYETIANYSGSTPDIIIVAGGVNDYANNVPLGNYDDTETSTVYGALNNIVSTLARDLTGIPVIFITPINCTRANDEEKLTYFNGIRNAVFEVAAKNNHMVVSGSDLGFPLVAGSYQEAVLYDGLHPTAAGHKMYCDAICGILL